MTNPVQEPLEAVAEGFLLSYLAVFDSRAEGGLFSKTKGRALTTEEIGSMREKIKASFRNFVKLPSDARLHFAGMFEKSSQAPMVQASLEGITTDKGIAESYRLFLVRVLRELSGE